MDATVLPLATHELDSDDEEDDGRCRATVLLGGCGDCRHYLATILDLNERCDDADNLRATIVLNDWHPEVVARAYVLCKLLDEAAELVGAHAWWVYGNPDNREAGKSMSAEAVIAVATAWHVHMSATLCGPMYAKLLEVRRWLATSLQLTRQC